MKTIISKKNNVMRKTNKFLTLLLVATFAITSCVQDDDYTVPSSLGQEENAKLEALLATATEISIQDVKDMYQGDESIEQISNDIYVKGYVTSSDQTGNFFKEFFIQDSPSNATTGLKVILNQVDSYNQFNFGREIYINLKGLYIGEERVGNGVITIGGSTETDSFGTTVESLNENQIASNILRSKNTMEITPNVVKFSQISETYLGLLVSVENAEFADNLAGKRYFDPVEVFDTSRTLQACEGFAYSQFQLETSSFASFKEELLPEGNGTITAVVSKTFDGSSLILVINSTDDVVMNDSRCSLLDINDFSVIFEEDFESMTANQSVTGNGWTNFAEAGTFTWRVRTSNDNQNSGSKIATMGAFNSNSASNIAWLISPVIDFDAQDSQFANFISSNSFSDNSELELLISTDWDGTTGGISTATWEALPGNIVDDSEFFKIG